MNSLVNSAKITKGVYIFILIVFAFLFSACVRLTWVYWATNTVDGNLFKWNNEFMVTTNDSYFWAEGTRDLILCDKNNADMGEYYQKNCHQENDLSPVNDPLPKLTHFIYDMLPFSLETIMFYMPVFAGSLIVIPFILIGGRFNLLLAGFIASLIAAISTSYYSRTVVGYYDTDIFNLFFPMMIVWSLAIALEARAKPYVLITALEMAVYKWCYPQGYALEFAFCGLVILYAIYIYLTEYKAKSRRYEEINLFNYQLLSILLISMAGIPFGVKIACIIALYLVVFRIKVEKYILYVLAAALLVFLFTDGFGPIISRLNVFIFQRDGTVDYGELQFFSVAQTIVEAQKISFNDIPLRLHGSLLLSLGFNANESILLFLISILGYAWLCIRKPVMLLLLPLLGLGLLSYWGGLRFVMYVIPVVAIGMGYFIFRITELAFTYIKEKKIALIASLVFTCLMSAWSLYPLIKTAWEYKAGSVFAIEEISLIENFGKNASREDYVLTWWDYGYPIRYYADIKTLVDGGKHDGDVNFPVSFALSHDQKSAAQMARLDVEYTEKRTEAIKNNQSIPNNNIAWIMKEYGFADSNDFMLSLKNDIKLPEKTRDIYFYLPYRMLDIYPTIMNFSHLDLMNGKPRPPFFYIARNFEDTGAVLFLDRSRGRNHFYIDKQQGKLITPPPNNSAISLKRFVVTGYDDKGAFYKNIQNMHYDGVYSLIYLRSYNVFLVVDEAMYDSVYFKLFYLEEYDANLFEFVTGNPYAKIYKLKI
ncbi:MAG: peptide transporter [Campylobacteraceae bacterium]|jgi:dolichyl-diphosphooligosaccharide--protein glycosyltransferase/undecaprenyl-diphosphooligosaccharide--protein glycosyltransferase|nr:peptide transporter [Campylobacteraceae bacterium]